MQSFIKFVDNTWRIVAVAVVLAIAATVIGISLAIAHLMEGGQP